MHHDINGNEAHLLLLPFLATNDLLRLSECCSSLLGYRYYEVSKLTLRAKPPLRPTSQALVRLVCAQQDDIQELVIIHSSVLRLLCQGPWFGRIRIMKLDISFIRLTDEECD